MVTDCAGRENWRDTAHPAREKEAVAGRPLTDPMNVSSRLAAASAALVAAVSLGAQPVPVQDLFRGYSFNQISMSPDGRVLATIFPHSKEKDALSLGLAVSELDTGQSRVLHREPLVSVIDIDWVGDNRMLTTLWGGFLRVGTFALNTDGSEMKVLLKPGEVGPMLGMRFMAEVPGAPGEVLMARRKIGDRYEKRGAVEDRAAAGVHRVNTFTGKATLITADPGWTTQWFADRAGVPRVAYGYEKTEFKPDGSPVKRDALLTQKIFWLDDSGTARELKKMKLGYREEFSPLGFDSAGAKFLFLGRQGGDLAALYAYNPASDEVEGPLLQSDHVDIDSAVRSPYDLSVVGLQIDEGLGRFEWLHPELRKIAPTVDRALPQYRNRFVGWGRDFRRVLIRSTSASEPGRYFIYDREKNSINEIYRSADWLKGFELGRTEAIEFSARDGTRLHGYFTWPTGPAPRGPVPTVLLVHGGPWTIRDRATYDPEVQFFATRGYAVLQVNFRGSGGYGRNFEELSRKQFGAAMQDDLMDAVDWAIAKQWADPQRLVVAGSSYGGYATLMALAQQPDRFRAGVALFPVTDLAKQINDYRALDLHGDRMLAYSWWKEWVGDPETDRARLDAVSPIRLVGRIKAPVFIVYGEKDERIQYEQSANYVRTLRSQKKRYERFAPVDEGHGLYREESRYKVYGALEKFLAKHVPIK